MNNLPILMTARYDNDVLIATRLLELLKITYEFIDVSEFNEDLYLVDGKEIIQSISINIFLFINVCTYYSGLLETTKSLTLSTLTNQWRLKHLQKVFPVFGEIFQNINRYSDVEQYGLSYLFTVLKQISFLHDKLYFHELDKSYIKISESNEYIFDLLSFLDPEYLYEYHPEIIKTKGYFTTSEITILRNLMGNEKCFELLKKNMIAEDFLSMPYLEQMVVLQKMSQYKHSASFLLMHLPKVMSNLISKDQSEITEPETAELRLEVIENLLSCGVDELHVWYEPLMNLLTRIKNGGSHEAIGTAVESSFL